MQVEMKVTGLTIDPVNNAPIVVLREKDGARVLPIWIGVIEASAIAFELDEVKLSRPMTHDLLRSTIESLGGKVERIVIVDLRENTYFAMILVSRDGEVIEIDARPSDAIALALRTDATILCESRVLEQAHVRQEEKAAAAEQQEPTPEAQASEEGEEEQAEGGPRPILVDEAQPRSWKEVLENLDPEDFGKYKM